jgi:lysophospholipase L1-like esterase
MLPILRRILLSILITATVGSAFANTAIEPASRGEKWELRYQKLRERAKQGDIDVLFLGDSITEHWTTAAPKGGREVWERHFAPLKAANLAISGDRTQNVLWMLDQGLVDGLNPKVVVIMLGTNNTGLERDGKTVRNTVPEVIEGVKTVVASVRKRLPESKILLLGIFPRGATAEHFQRQQVAEINAGISGLGDGKHIHYLDITDKFLSADGSLGKEVMPDFLHPNEAGYQIWADAIEQPLKKLLSE